MLRSAKDLFGFSIHATDGEIGTAQDFLFDDQDWMIRYLVAGTGRWFTGREVLISPPALGSPDQEGKAFPIDLTRDQIKNSPPLETDMPVSERNRLAIKKYYRWRMYWVPVQDHMDVTPALILPPVLEPPEPSADQSPPEDSPGDPHLRSVKAIISYAVEASDGHIGHIADMILDDRTWTIRYFVIDTGTWRSGRKVLLSAQWVLAIHWSTTSVKVDLPLEVIKNSPEYDPSVPVSREYENTLHDYYDRPKYWEK